MWAAYKGCTDVADLLLEKGANPNITGQVMSLSGFKLSIRSERAPTYICSTDPLPLPQQYSVYPIIWAAGRGHAEIVHLLLQHGAKVNCSDKVMMPSSMFFTVWLSYSHHFFCYLLDSLVTFVPPPPPVRHHSTDLGCQERPF